MAHDFEAMRRVAESSSRPHRWRGDAVKMVRPPRPALPACLPCQLNPSRHLS